MFEFILMPVRAGVSSPRKMCLSYLELAGLARGTRRRLIPGTLAMRRLDANTNVWVQRDLR
jgi:hypothetical protein